MVNINENITLDAETVATRDAGPRDKAHNSMKLPT